MTQHNRQVHLAAHFPGVNNTTIWSDPDSGSHIEFSSFEHLARTAERGFFDFFFLAEGLRLREHKGKIFDLDVAGRPNTLAVLSALAGVTDNIGLAGTLSTTYNEPFELARQLATLDHLSGGRAAWNVVTSPDAFTGENFRRGGYLEYADRYHRAEDFIHLSRRFWDADPSEIVEHISPFFEVGTRFPVPTPPQGHPVVLQAGDSDQGREFAAGSADVIFTRHGSLEEGTAFYRDVKRRLAAYGRGEDDLKIFPGVTVVLGDSEADARERAAEIHRQQVSGPGAIAFLEQVWGRDLTGYDPDGPLPTVEPDTDGASITRGRVRHVRDPRVVADHWRSLAQERNLSIRELVIEVSARTSFVGTHGAVAGQLSEFVQQRAADGFILVPSVTPGGLDEFVERVVPELQDRGVYRSDYPGITLRENLGLPPHRPAAQWARYRHTDSKVSALS
ncbi:NtaA/DmoA family FMN-dependent monooxygenase [Corynebacterium pacaense]|uniref:NtaA/DmoA family FMN-dependent monooxygenase n=1 Tax=Corynebacterium pacaense TaxID=1816684 RepID=UPI0009B9F77D|nr:NtaA/DmoA family FMN-dependent monooxygenase [Corynebacterium pacaense]